MLSAAAAWSCGLACPARNLLSPGQGKNMPGISSRIAARYLSGRIAGYVAKGNGRLLKASLLRAIVDYF